MKTTQTMETIARSEEAEVSLQVMIPAELQRSTKAAAGLAGITMRELVMTALRAELERRANA